MSGNSFKKCSAERLPSKILTIPSPGKKAGMNSSGMTQHRAALELPGLSLASPGKGGEGRAVPGNLGRARQQCWQQL